MIRKCRDCGQQGSEDPDDPAPALCPNCFKKRLDRITPKFMQMVESLDHPWLAAAWLEEALIDIGGELPEYAHQHAQMLLREALR